MTQDIEQVQARLANIRVVGPILAALRTISLGSWQMALNRQTELESYAENLLALLPVLLPHLAGKSTRRHRRSDPPVDEQQPKNAQLLVIGTERGLCGRFNTSVAERVVQYMTTRELSGGQVTLTVLGARVARKLASTGYELPETQSLPVTSLPPFELASSLTQRWLRSYEDYTLDAVDVIYNAYQGAGRYAPQLTRLIPPVLPSRQGQLSEEFEPPTIMETDPLHLYARVVEQWSAISLYGLLLSSAAAEHSARFQLMESATQNSDRLVEELTLEVQSARRQAITREMQELAAGSGLFDA